jgi:hypothetical protein
MPERSRHGGYQAGPGARVAGGEQRDVMPAIDQQFGQGGNDTFGATVPGGRHSFKWWCNLSDAQRNLRLDHKRKRCAARFLLSLTPDVSHRPVVFHMPAALNDAIAYQPARQAIADGSLPQTVNDWLEEQAMAEAYGLFTIGWVGWLVSGRLAAAGSAGL